MEHARGKAVRKRYGSDLSARDWQRLEPPLVVRRRGKWPLAEVVNAILYVLKNGCVLPANAADGPAAIAFRDEVAMVHNLLGRAQMVFVDSSFNGFFSQHLAYGIRVEKPAHVLIEKTNFCIHSWC